MTTTSNPRAAAELRERGWTLVPDLVPPAVLTELRADLDRAYDVCRAVQAKNGIAAETDGAVHHLPLCAPSFLRFLDPLPLRDVIADYFGAPFILNTYGGFLNRKGVSAYVGKVHRDVRTFSGALPVMINMLVPVDAFTIDNGATHLLDGSHRQEQKPDDADFFARASRLVGPAGSVCLFNSNVWHAAGINRTGEPRRALTLAFTRSSTKQQLDYPRALGYDDGDRFAPALRQLLGYDARVPVSLDEWYQPPERRFYKPNQG